MLKTVHDAEYTGLSRENIMDTVCCWSNLACRGELAESLGCVYTITASWKCSRDRSFTQLPDISGIRGYIFVPCGKRKKLWSWLGIEHYQLLLTAHVTPGQHLIWFKLV